MTPYKVLELSRELFLKHGSHPPVICLEDQTGVRLCLMHDMDPEPEERTRIFFDAGRSLGRTFGMVAEDLKSLHFVCTAVGALAEQPAREYLVVFSLFMADESMKQVQTVSEVVRAGEHYDLLPGEEVEMENNVLPMILAGLMSARYDHQELKEMIERVKGQLN